MKNSIILFLLLIPTFLFSQYPNTGNKARLGYQTTGDGLIWRGVAADTVLKPRVIAHAYFQLDTVNAVLRRYIATRGSWQVVGGGSETDSTVYATKYWTSTNFFPLEGGTLTGTGGAGFIGFPSQVSAPGTPASGLNVYAQGSSFNWKGTDGYERQFASTLTGGRTYTLPDISGTFALGTGTADRLARWTATNTLAAGNLSDNGTRLQALLPWQFQTYTTAGLPTGVTGYHVYNTTTNGPAWYQGSRWAYGLESTFNRGTSTYVPFFDANGQITQSANFTFSTSTLTTTGTAGTKMFVSQNSISANNKAAISDDGLYFSRTSDGAYLAAITRDPSSSTPGNGSTTIAYSGSRHYFYNANAATLIATIMPGIYPERSTVDGIMHIRYMQFRQFTGISNEAPYFYSDDANGVGTKGFSFDRSIRVASGNAGVMTWNYNNVEFARMTTSGALSFGTITPDASAILQFNSTTRGILPPRWTATQRTAISSPATGLFGYQTDGSEGMYVKAASGFKRLLWEGDAVTTNIYTANGTLAGDRVVNGGTHNIDFGSGTVGNLPEFNVYADKTYFFGYDAPGRQYEYSIEPNYFSLIVDNIADDHARVEMQGDTITFATGDGSFTDDESFGLIDKKFFVDNAVEISLRSDGTAEIFQDDTETSIYNPTATEIGTDAAKFITDQATGTATITGKVTALRESYNIITSTTSPQTLSSTIPDNLVSQGSTQASFTFLFPATPQDGQVLTLTWNNAISTLTLDGNGNTIVGSAVTTAVAGSQRAFKFYTGIGWIKLY